jgi:hypothetical protein
MDHSATRGDKGALVIGLIAAAIGLTFTSMAAGVLPIPGGRASIQGPVWLLFCGGLVFLFAGLAVVIQFLGGAGQSGDLPAGAPLWLRTAHYLAGLVVVASLAAIGTWIAIGSGPRSFTMSTPFFSGESSEWLGRAVFGFGAALVWLFLIAFAISGIRRLLAQDRK